MNNLIAKMHRDWTNGSESAASYHAELHMFMETFQAIADEGVGSVADQSHQSDIS